MIELNSLWEYNKTYDATSQIQRDNHLVFLKWFSFPFLEILEYPIRNLQVEDKEMFEHATLYCHFRSTQSPPPPSQGAGAAAACRAHYHVAQSLRWWRLTPMRDLTWRPRRSSWRRPRFANKRPWQKERPTKIYMLSILYLKQSVNLWTIVGLQNHTNFRRRCFWSYTSSATPLLLALARFRKSEASDEPIRAIVLPSILLFRGHVVRSSSLVASIKSNFKRILLEFLQITAEA